MAGAKDIRAGGAFVELMTKNNPFIRGLDAAARKFKAFGLSVTRIGLSIAGIGSVIASAFTYTTKVFADAGSEMYDMAQRTGASVEALSGLKYIADQAGTSIESLETGIRQMQKSITAAAGGSSEANEALKNLGLTVADLDGLSPDEQFKLISDRLMQIPDATVRAAMAMKIFGKSGTDLLPMMEGGAAGMDAMIKRAEELGLIMSTEDAAAADRFGDAMSDLWKVIKMGVFNTGAALAEWSQQYLERVIEIAASVGRWIKQNRGLAVTILKVASGIAAAGAVITAMGIGIAAVGFAMGGLSAAIGAIGATIGFLISPLGLVIVALGVGAAALLYFTDAGGIAVDWLMTKFGELKDFVGGVVTGISDALSAGDIALAAQILWTGLKVAWLTGVNALDKVWQEFLNGFWKVAYTAFYGVQAAWEELQHGLEVVWIESVAFLGGLWDGFVGAFTNAWDTAVTTVAKGLNYIHGLWDETFDTDAANAAADQMLGSNEAARQAAELAAAQKREDERAASRDESARQHTQSMAEIGAAFDAAIQNVDAETAKKLEEARAEMEALQMELQRLRDEAAGKASDAGGGPATGNRPTPQNFDDVVQGLSDLNNKFTSRGSFNPFGVSQMGGNNAAERTAKATEETAKGVKRIEQKGGMAWSG